MRYLFVVLFILPLIGCGKGTNSETEHIRTKDNNNSQEAVRLNNEAMTIYQKSFLTSSIDTVEFIRMNNLLDSAIQLDSNFYQAYISKSLILCRYKMFINAIDCMNNILRRRGDYVEGWVFLGMLYDKNGKDKDADSLFKRALRIYQNRLRSKFNLPDAENEIFLYKMLGQEDSANYRLKNVLSKDTSNVSQIKDFISGMKYFNRKRYVDNIFRE